MAPPSHTEDYYKVLRITQDATHDMIVKSYRQLALKLHPDRNSSPNATAEFQQLGQAYDNLADPNKRRAYDFIYASIKRNPDPHFGSNNGFRDNASPQPGSSTPNSGQQGPPPRNGSDTHPNGAKTVDAEAEEIARIQRLMQIRKEAWRSRKTELEASVFERRREMRRIEKEIEGLNSIIKAEAAAEAKKKSWSWWLYSSLYKQRPVGEEEESRLNIERQERRMAKDMKERRCQQAASGLKQQEGVLHNGQEEFDAANLMNQERIATLWRALQAREARKRAEEEQERRKEAEEARRQQEQKLHEEWAERVKAEEARQKQQAAQRARVAEERRRKAEVGEQKRRQQAQAEATRRTQAAQSERSQYRYGSHGYESRARTESTLSCEHHGWWDKVQGRRSCPHCHEIWTYLLECPGCNLEACPKCQKDLRPRFRRR